MGRRCQQLSEVQNLRDQLKVILASALAKEQ